MKMSWLLPLVLGVQSTAWGDENMTRRLEEQNAEITRLKEMLSPLAEKVKELERKLADLQEPSSLHTFKLPGRADEFYPVFFSNGCWEKGNTELTISRANVHLDASWLGSLVARFRYHGSQWGHRSQFLEASVRQDFTDSLADFTLPWISYGLVVWLRGDRTYQYSGNCPTKPLFDTEKPLVTWSHPDYAAETAAMTFDKIRQVNTSRVRNSGEWALFLQ